MLAANAPIHRTVLMGSARVSKSKVNFHSKNKLARYIHIKATRFLKHDILSQNHLITSEMCTGTFQQNDLNDPTLAPPGTKCAWPCTTQSGIWGSSLCNTDDDRINWGAPCVPCRGNIFSFQNSLRLLPNT